MWKSTILKISVMVLFLAGCGAQPQGGESQVKYKEVKDMVVDILKTEEGKKAIDEATNPTSGMHAQGLNVGQNQQIKLAVKEVLTSPEYELMFNEIMKDPKFAADFAKVVLKGNKKIHKDLMKDPEYQKQLMDIMKNQQVQKMLLDLMKSTEYRKQAMAIMQESFQSPLFQMEIMKLLDKVVEEQLKPDAEKKKKKESGG